MVHEEENFYPSTEKGNIKRSIQTERPFSDNLQKLKRDRKNTMMK